MPAQDQRQELFIADRVRSLATLYLTRIDGLIIAPPDKANVGFDFRVVIDRGKVGLREFGVELRGTWKTTTKQGADSVLRPTFAQAIRIGGFPFPVFLMYFTMQEDQGWLAWINRPLVNREKPILVLQHQPDCKPLSDAIIRRAVDEIDGWWDAYYKGNVSPAKAARKSHS